VTTKPRTIRDALAAARPRLGKLPQSDPGLESEVLLAHLLGCDRTWLYARSDQALSAADAARFDRLVVLRASGVPVAHLTGRREFWSLPLQVTPDTLIPRPETEVLVEWALTCLPPRGGLRALDLGTGTGAVALALARERPDIQVIAGERSAPALRVACANRDALGIPNVAFVRGDWLAPFALSSQFDLVVSNPPYVAADDPHLSRGDVAHEPREALLGGADGLTALRRIITAAPAYLRPGGWLLLEHGADQGAPVRELLDHAGLSDAATRRDLAGLERVSGARLDRPQRP
jgi:release factor glutamine methyltransferase